MPSSPGDRFLALGDSYTIGEAVAAADRWPVRLAAALRERGVAIGNPRIVARTGWTVAELAAAIERAALAPGYALVSLSIGVNDQYRGYPLAEFRERYPALLELAADLAGAAARVLVVSIPDWSATPFAGGDPRGRERIAIELASYNDLVRGLSLAAGAVYADITPATRAMADDPALVAADGLHPSAPMYARWVAQLEPIARRMLTEKRPSCR